MTARVAALLGLGAFTLPWWPSPWLGLLVVTATVAGLTLVDLLLAAPLGRLALRREGDRTSWLGTSATVTLWLRNDSRRRLHAQVRDAWTPSAGAVAAAPVADPPTAGSPAAEPADPPPARSSARPAAGTPERTGGPVWQVRLTPGSAVALPARLTPTRRGDRPAADVTVRSVGPLGLAFRQRRGRPVTPPWTLRVLPRFDSRRLLPEKVARLRVIDGMRATRGRGQGTEFDNLREYVVGDDVRSIDWRASARRADVLVRTWRPERDRRVVCVLDTGRTSAARIGDEPRLDVTIDAALLLAALANRAGDRVDLLAVDSAVRAAVSGTSRQLLMPRLVGALAPLRPTLAETDYELVVGEVLRRESKRALVVLCTALEPGALGDGLLPVLPQLAARHQVVVASVQDPTLTALIDEPPRDVGDVYAAAAAWRTAGERDRIRTALSRYGVLVLDAPPATFASRLADLYLHLKLLGRL
ncbi:DUF58 domain-containing protein [Micromonospora sp. NBC_01813]|uniref:DUF58 domain-containing protein n=1 Tax=Micromonospora sp. NBC_01813 TaxID=2975988 RepID=UPI002DD80E40|nr:DUF58 domain-containing protein [Micromonospora sp. NBC_01813]WSA08448.1 DUF58 domain-containing protein [Micromonospora sp. NBC_01813]